LKDVVAALEAAPARRVVLATLAALRSSSMMSKHVGFQNMSSVSLMCRFALLLGES
jgi:hypothetical protein